MSEKKDFNETFENSSADISTSDIIEQLELGFITKAIRLAEIKLGVLNSILQDVIKAAEQNNGLIAKEDWQKEQAFIEEQIVELGTWLAEHKDI